MSTINIDLAADTILNVMIGQQDENEVREVVFDFSGWYTTYGSGTISLAIQRPKDEWPYEGELTVDSTNHKATWEISDTDTAYAGTGQIQLSYKVGDAKKKSVVYRFTCHKSLGALGSVVTPVQIQTFIDEVEEELQTMDGRLDDMDDQIADVKADLVELQEEIEGGGSGLTDRQKALFITILRNALYSSNQKSNIDELEESFTNMVLSITATLDLAGNTIYSDDTLDTLRQYLTVKANYDDGTKQVITDYTLAGTLVVPSSTIQVGYRDKTASVTVPVSQAVTKYTITNNLTGVTNSNNSTVISEGNTYMGVLSANTTGYMVTNVSIMVGSTDVTSTAYNSDTNTITIENVQGNITITASEAINPLLPVYELASTMTASGTIDYALFDQEQDWTIVYTMNTPANSGRVSISNLLSNYYGFRIISDYVAGTDTLKIWNGTSNQLNKGWLDGTVAGSQKIVVTHDADGSSIGYWKQTNMKSGHEASGEGSKTLTVGETVTPNNQPFTVTITGDATLSDFKIYKRVLTNEEISEYVGWTVG